MLDRLRSPVRLPCATKQLLVRSPSERLDHGTARVRPQRLTVLPGEHLARSRGGVTHPNRATQYHFHQPSRVASRRARNVFDTNVTNSEIPQNKERREDQ